MAGFDSDIAIVGIGLRVPGASNPTTFWGNLREGRESVRRLTEDELLKAGVPRETFLRPNYVRAAATLDRMEVFDAEFFGFSPKEAAIMDPQHRQFLEVCWEAFEDAGHLPDSFDGSIGMFAGCGMGGYFAFNLLSNPDLVRNVGTFLLRHTGNDKDFLTTRASYLFDLRGPSVNVQTACSTSLVATHLACQHLLSGECDMALAGGVTIEIPHGRGYHYEPGEILSPDGHCRAFDHRSEGTVFGSGAAVVVLRRLQDAVAAGDCIYAVIKATAVNNDGSSKVGYLAPSVEGQAACISEALAVADVSPDSIRYVECHGTGTRMGDPIEVAALTQAFRGSAAGNGYCGIGSVKSNIGHLDTAAGVVGLAKAALALHHREIPPTINFEESNPLIEFATSPFYVQDSLQPWERRPGVPRRAGVNSLGVGGTNAFAILEEHSGTREGVGSRPWRLITLSARNRAALDANAVNLAQHLRDHPDLDLGDVSWTLQVGRRAFAERRVLAARGRDEAIALLEAPDSRRVFTHTASAERQSVAFMFPGGGSQYARMAAGLYEAEPSFAQHIDRGLRLLKERHGVDLQPLLLCGDGQVADARAALEAPSLQLPGIFLVEYALAQLLMEWGLKPTALLGHSVGENTAACVAGTMGFEDCLGLVVLRGRLMDRVSGGMVAVPLPVAELQPHLDTLGLDLAAVNAPELCVASGAVADIAALESRLGELGIEAHRVKIDIAAHSRLLEPILDEFGAYLRSIRLSPPSIRWVSNRTGTWITDEEATSPQYWVDHLRGTVQFADCLATLAEEPGRVFLEVGPGKTLSSLAKAQPSVKAGQAIIPTMRHADEQVPDDGFLLTALGRLWACGGRLDGERLFSGERRRRVRLPTYAFQGQRYFFEPGTGAQQGRSSEGLLVDREADESSWYWAPAWKMREADDPVGDPVSWLVFLDDAGIGAGLVERMKQRGDRVVVVRAGDSFQRLSDDEYVIAPEHGRAAYDALVHDLVRSGHAPDRVAHLALLSRTDSFRPGSSLFHRDQEQGFYSLLFFAQAWASEGPKRALHIVAATAGMQSVGENDPVSRPEQATLLGPTRVIPREFPDVTVSCVDVDPGSFVKKRRVLIDLADNLIPARRSKHPDGNGGDATPALALLEAELRAPASNDIVAHRNSCRYVQTIRRKPVAEGGEIPLRHNGVVVITGGLGGIGLTIAGELAVKRQARIVLLSRTSVPERAQWPDLIRKLGPDHHLSGAIAAIEELERLGTEVLLLQADVTHIESMRAAMEAVRQRYGCINGLVHAAGIVRDDLVMAKDQSDIEEVLAPKVYGTLVLDEVLRDDDLDLFVVFSSTSTMTAPPGQVDYVAANAFLNAFAQARSRKARGRTIALNWGVWSDVGMAARSAAQVRQVGRRAETKLASHPYFHRFSTDAKGVATFEARWSAAEQWFLAEHRTAGGDALLPGAGYLELAAAALREIGLAQPFEIQDLLFLRPLAVNDGGRDVRVRLTPSAEGYSFEVAIGVDLDASLNPGAKSQTGWRKVAQAELILGEQPGLAPVDLAAVEAALPRRLPAVTKQQNHLRFGPRWDVVERVIASEEQALAHLNLPDAFRSDLEDFGLHPALVDLATGYAMDLIPGYTGDSLWVPVSYHAIRVQGRLPAEICSIVTLRDGSTQDGGFAQFDVAITDRQGNVLVAAEKFTVKRLDASLDLGRDASNEVDEIEHDGVASADRTLSPAELAFQHNLSQGIRRDEGRRAFARALGGYQGAQLYVSSMDLQALVAQTDAAARLQNVTSSAEPSFARPQLDSTYVEPRDDIEATLTELWRDLLGVSQVGVLDSFFDLGGHSLIAVRLFAKVKRVFSVDFPISVLFEAPTIEACAALIRSARPSGAGDGEQASTVSTRPRYRHLVPMHAGEGGSGRPFFLVAGMFGNVLNLRHLAHQIGMDRPFYGIQARGVYGTDEPHETFEEMARDYLEEIRLVQPQGPYTLGGFSGGGIAALEMVRQLNEQGEEVDLLVMLDTPLPRSERLTWKDKVVMHAQNFRRAGPRHILNLVQGRAAWRRQMVQEQNALGSVEQGGLHSAAIGAAFHRALARYEVRPYDGVVTLFRPKLQPAHIFGPGRQINAQRRFIYEDNGWGPFCRQAAVFEVPGDHDSMVLEPNVRVLAAKIREAINGVGRKRTSHVRPVVAILHPQASGSIVVRPFPRQPHGTARPRRTEAVNGHNVPAAPAAKGRLESERLESERLESESQRL